jgi:hypothetical protein
VESTGVLNRFLTPGSRQNWVAARLRAEINTPEGRRVKLSFLRPKGPAIAQPRPSKAQAWV